jgi:hypothetical protein
MITKPNKLGGFEMTNLPCKQGSICCPALKFFIKEKGGNTDE